MCWFGAFSIATSLLSAIGGGAEYRCVVVFGVRVKLLLFLLCLLCCDVSLLCGCVGGVNVIGLVLVMSVRCVHFWCVVGCGL